MSVVLACDRRAVWLPRLRASLLLVNANVSSRLVSVERYDVVILGYRVPGANGVQLVRFIRALEHRKTTAVVMVTGSTEVADEALAAGADEVLPKPIDPNALVHAVEKHVHLMEKRAS